MQAKGCHALIKEGAALVESFSDVLDVLGPGADTCPDSSRMRSAKEKSPTIRGRRAIFPPTSGKS